MSLFSPSHPRDEQGNELRRRTGRIRGTVRAASQVLIGQGAQLEGDLHTREAVIGGEVVGSIHAIERVELQATASVTGNIHTPRIAVMEGGKVSGEVRIQEPAIAEPA